VAPASTGAAGAATHAAGGRQSTAAGQQAGVCFPDLDHQNTGELRVNLFAHVIMAGAVAKNDLSDPMPATPLAKR